MYLKVYRVNLAEIKTKTFVDAKGFAFLLVFNFSTSQRLEIAREKWPFLQDLA